MKKYYPQQPELTPKQMLRKNQSQPKKRLIKKNLLGILGELLARKFLQIKLYQIIATRHRNYFGEIDIIAKKKDFIVFVEVKSRITSTKELANMQILALSNRQSERIKKASSYFIQKGSKKYNINNKIKPRFDFILITNHWPFIKH